MGSEKAFMCLEILLIIGLTQFLLAYVFKVHGGV